MRIPKAIGIAALMTTASMAACDTEVVQVQTQAASSSGAGASGGGTTSAGGSTASAGGSTSTGMTWTPTPEQQAACDAFWTDRCAQYQSCLPLFFDIFWGDPATCVASQAELCTSVFAPGSNTDVDDVNRCSAAVDMLQCGDFLRYLFGQAVPSECPETPGNLANGETCFSGAQCQSNRCERPAGNGNCGVCSDQIQANDPCDPDVGGCARGLTCQGGSCRVPNDIGGNCGLGLPCYADLSCFNNTCQTAGLDGDPCQPMTVQPCAQGYYCNFNTNMCETITQTSNGNACGIIGGGAVLCENGSHCEITNLQLYQGTCETELGPGSDCSGTWATGPCARPLGCVQGTCSAFDIQACL